LVIFASIFQIFDQIPVYEFQFGTAYTAFRLDFDCC
jgi:hypothetical protein